VSILASGPVHFGQIPEEHRYQPSWTDEPKETEEREKMVKDDIRSNESVSSCKMCRSFSGSFYRHPLLQNFRYSWLVEPGVHFYCDVNFDPFVFMHENNKTYGLAVALRETRRTIDSESLWSTLKDSISQHPESVVLNNGINLLSDDGSGEYNLYMLYNNFEIADLAFWRGEAYAAYFEYLDRLRGIYEHWGDAPVHSMAVALAAGTDRIHFFHEIGYENYPFTHCPTGDLWTRGRCACDPKRHFDYEE